MYRKRIDKENEVSTDPYSIIVTDNNGEQTYVAPGNEAQVLTVTSGIPTWADVPYPSEFEIYADYASFPGSGSTDIIYYATAENLFYVWNGAAYVEVPAASSFSCTVAGDAGVNQTITNGNTITFSGANGFTFAGQATDTIKFVPPTGTNGQVLTWNSGSSTWQAATPATTFLTAADSGPNQTITIGSDTLHIVGGESINTVASATDTITINLSPFGISYLGDVDTSGAANGAIMYYDGTNWVDYAIGTSGQVLTVSGGVPVWTTPSSQTLNVSADGGTNPAVILGSDTLNIVGGTGIDTTGNNGTDTVTIDLNAAISDLTDVDTTGAVNTNVLTFNGTNWVDTAGATWLGNFSVDAMSDVVTSGAALGSLLLNNGTNWVNKGIGSANQVLTVSGGTATWAATQNTTTVSDTDTVDLTLAGVDISADVLFSAGSGNVVHNSSGSAGVGAFPRTEYFTPAGGTATITLATTPMSGTPVHVYINGDRAPYTTAWTIAGAVITIVGNYATNLADYQGVVVDYWIANA